MARAARVVAEGVPHHITQRGNNRQNIFLLDEDRRFYIEALRAKSRQYGLTILGYCLMTNHVHLIAIPTRPYALAKAIGQAHWRYTMHFNKSTARQGHLWQNRFYSCTLGPSHLVAALTYVDLNPVRAAMAGSAVHYPWSSAAAHCGNAADDRLIDAPAWGKEALAEGWAERLRTESAGLRDDELRRATYSGLPFGSEEFVDEMELRLGRGLRAKPPGPAPNTKNASSVSA